MPLLQCSGVLEEVDVRFLEEDDVVIRYAVEEGRLASVGFVSVQLDKSEYPGFSNHPGGC